MSPSNYNVLIFDIDNILPGHNPNILPNILKELLSSQTWFEYERLGQAFSLTPEQIGSTLDQVRDSRQLNETLVSAIRELKALAYGELRIVAMSSISSPDYEALRANQADWKIFDEVFTSCSEGERRPHFRFYRKVIAKAGIDPQMTIFVDDQVENVLTARSMALPESFSTRMSK